jgi:hypothetical protein
MAVMFPNVESLGIVFPRVGWISAVKPKSNWQLNLKFYNPAKDTLLEALPHFKALQHFFIDIFHEERATLFRVHYLKKN